MTNEIAPPIFARTVNINDDDWRDLEVGGNVTLNDDLRARLADIMETYLADTDIKAKGVTQNKVEAALRNFHKSLDT